MRPGKSLKEVRASSSDGQTTVMKMTNGGYRLAFNAVEFSTDPQVIVRIAVVTTGSDRAQRQSMVDQVAERYSHPPAKWLVEVGFAAHDYLDAVAARMTVYAPVPKPKAQPAIQTRPKPKTAPRGRVVPTDSDR